MSTSVTDTIPFFNAPTPEGYSMMTAPIKFMHAAHTAHGGVCRMQFSDREWVLLTGTEANEFVWSSNDLWSYRDSRTAFLEELGEPHVTSSDGAKHRTKRKLINKSFSVSSNMRYLPRIAQIVQKELDIASLAGEPVALRQWLPRVITRFNMETVSQVSMSEDEFEKMVRWQLHFIAGTGLSKERRDAYYSEPEYLLNKESALATLGRMVDERLADPNPPDDNFQQVIEARAKADLPGSREELSNELYYILVAGIQNTTHFVITMLREIYTPPSWVEWLREEIDPWDGKDVMAVGAMERLKAFALEIQRNRPQNPVLGLYPKRDFEFAGHNIPAGTLCIYCPSFMHFEEHHYERPWEFDPTRFLNGGKFSPKTNGFFGGGAHVCVGRNVTLLQGPLIVALILKHFDLSEVPLRDELLSEQAGGEAQTPCHVRIQPRSSMAVSA